MHPTEDLNPTSTPTLSQAQGKLAAKKDVWAALGPAGRLSFLQKILSRLQDVDHEGWGTAAADSLGYSSTHPAGDYEVSIESMVNASVCIGTVQHLIRTFEHLATQGTDPEFNRSTRGNREVVQVFPVDRADKFTPEGMGGCTGEVWLKPEQDTTTGDQVSGRVCLVLGAGNQSFLSFGDVMYQLFVEGAVCLLKHHPLRDFSRSYFDSIFADLTEAGFFAACEADLNETQELLHSPLVDCVHMTGGTHTHDAIVWGHSPDLQAKNKAADTPVLKKTISSELGCVTPWIVTPGTEWSEREIGHMAGQLVTAFVAQNSCNCLSPKVVILDSDWPQREQFLNAVRQRLKNTPSRPPHYPGTAERYNSFVANYDDSCIEMIASKSHPGMANHDLGPCLPWLLVNLDKDSPAYALQTEAFAPVLGIYTLSAGNDAERFLSDAVTLANDAIWGSLSCTLIAHPDLDLGPEGAVERAIEGLRYGSIGVNIWTASVYSTSGLTWGAYPGEDLANVASGRGIVRNAYRLKGVEKSILRSPFMSKAHLVTRTNGRLDATAAQFRAIRQMLVKPGVISMIGMFRELATPDPASKISPSLGQRCFVAVLGCIEAGLKWVTGLVSKAS